jgi:hypothetical protein
VGLLAVVLCETCLFEGKNVEGVKMSDDFVEIYLGSSRSNMLQPHLKASKPSTIDTKQVSF